MSENSKNRFKNVRYSFDKITSANATSWKLVIFWIFLFEIVATIIEYLYVENSLNKSISIPHTLETELLVALIVTYFVWFCIYNIIFENRTNIFRLAIFSILGLYFIVTNDLTLNFLMQNLNPLHFFDLEFGFVFFIELFFKLIITYLLYQLIISLKNRAVTI